jgi:hypothetical protein
MKGYFLQATRCGPTAVAADNEKSSPLDLLFGLNSRHPLTAIACCEDNVHLLLYHEALCAPSTSRISSRTGLVTPVRTRTMERVSPVVFLSLNSALSNLSFTSISLSHAFATTHNPFFVILNYVFGAKTSTNGKL